MRESESGPWAPIVVLAPTPCAARPADRRRWRGAPAGWVATTLTAAKSSAVPAKPADRGAQAGDEEHRERFASRARRAPSPMTMPTATRTAASTKTRRATARGRRAERHAHADLAGAARHRVGEHREEAGHGQRQAHRAHAAEQRRADAGWAGTRTPATAASSGRRRRPCDRDRRWPRVIARSWRRSPVDTARHARGPGGRRPGAADRGSRSPPSAPRRACDTGRCRRRRRSPGLDVWPGPGSIRCRPSGVRPLQIPAHERLVDDRHRRRADASSAAVKSRPCRRGMPSVVEDSRGRPCSRPTTPGTPRRRLAALVESRAGRAAVPDGQRHAERERGAFEAGQRLDALDGAAAGTRARLRRVATLDQAHLSDQRVRDVEAGARRARPREVAEEEERRHEQHHRHRHLAGDEQAAQRPAPVQIGASVCLSAGVSGRARRLQRRQHPLKSVASTTIDERVEREAPVERRAQLDRQRQRQRDARDRPASRHHEQHDRRRCRQASARSSRRAAAGRAAPAWRRARARTASSRRTVLRARISPATLAQAMPSTSPPTTTRTAKKLHSLPRPGMPSVTGANAPTRRFRRRAVGRRRCTTVLSAAAPCSRPAPRQPADELRARGVLVVRGRRERAALRQVDLRREAKAGDRPRRPFGRTPTTVYGWPLTISVRPTAPRCRAEAVRQKPSLIDGDARLALRGRFAAVKPRPSAIGTPSTSKKLAVTMSGTIVTVRSPSRQLTETSTL